MQYRCVSIQARSEHRHRPAFLVIAIPLLCIACQRSALLLRCSSPLSMPPQGFATPSHSTSDRCHFYSDPCVSTAIRFYSWRFRRIYGLFNALALRHVSMLFRHISKICPSIANRFASVHCDAAAVQPFHSHPRLDGSLPVLSMAAPCLPFPSQSQLRNSVSERVCAYPSLNTPSSRR